MCDPADRADRARSLRGVIEAVLAAQEQQVDPDGVRGLDDMGTRLVAAASRRLSQGAAREAQERARRDEEEVRETARPAAAAAAADPAEGEAATPPPSPSRRRRVRSASAGVRTMARGGGPAGGRGDGQALASSPSSAAPASPSIPPVGAHVVRRSGRSARKIRLTTVRTSGGLSHVDSVLNLRALLGTDRFDVLDERRRAMEAVEALALSGVLAR